MASSHVEDDLQLKRRPSQRSSQPFAWLMTQEHSLLATSENQLVISSRAKEVVSQKSRFRRPFTQVDFPSFTQLVADEENSLALPDPYKPLPKPRNPLELSELSWKVIQELPEKNEILNNLVNVLENTDVRMKSGKFEIFLKQNLESAPYKKTFLVTCPLIVVESSSSDSSSQESSESDDTSSVISTDGNESQTVLRNSNGLNELEPTKQLLVTDISNDLDISSSSGSEDEDPEISASSTDIVRANKFPSPELPSKSQTESKFITDMPNIDEFSSVGTQTDLSMEDIEKLTKRRASKESQVKSVSGVIAGDQQQRPKRRKKSIVRIGLPRLKNKIK